MNKKSIIIIIVIAIIILAGVIILVTKNGSSKVPTVELFEQKAKEQGYTIGEIDNPTTQSKPVTATKMATSSDYRYFIEMYVLNDENSAKEFYNEKKQNFEQDKKEEDKPSEVSKNNADIYTLKSNGYSMYVKRIENVLISYTVSEDDEQKANEFVRSL